MTHPTQAGIGLVRMGESSFIPANLEDDVRGKDVYDAEGRRVGSVEDLYIDRQEREVRFLEVSFESDANPRRVAKVRKGAAENGAEGSDLEKDPRAPRLALIHSSAWKGLTAEFAC
jgi:hypothetical protein